MKCVPSPTSVSVLSAFLSTRGPVAVHLQKNELLLKKLFHSLRKVGWGRAILDKMGLDGLLTEPLCRNRKSIMLGVTL